MVESKFGTVAILAGGKSSRMGFNKELLEVDNKKLIHSNIIALEEIFEEVIIVTNNPKYYNKFNVRTVKDIYFQKGPLSGIHSALTYGKSKYIYILPCDIPFIDLEFVELLKEEVNISKKDVVVGRKGRFIEPFNGFYSKKIIKEIEKNLETERLSIHSLLEKVKVEYIDLEKINIGVDIFLNLNTKEELYGYIERRRKIIMESVTKLEMLKIKGEEKEILEDSIVEEYPFTIFLNDKELLTLLCTKKSLEYLVVGFLISEGIIEKKEDIIKMKIDKEKGVAYIETSKDKSLVEKLYGKRTLTSGCGKGTVFYNVVDSFKSKKVKGDFKLELENIPNIMREFNRHSQMFLETGGVHSCALSDGEKNIISADDIGRHNALDKIIGEAICKHVDLSDKIVLTTGRISSEIMIKIAKRGIPAIISKSAPTKLAVDIAKDLNITVIGFARGIKMNIYTNYNKYL